MAKMIATGSFVAVVDGQEINVSAGVTRVDDSSDLYRLYPHNWVRDDGAPDVEDATADPGVKRGARKAGT